MNLEKLLERAKEIENAVFSVSQQLQALQGHKAETAHWIKQLEEAQSVVSSMIDNTEEKVIE